MAIEVCFEVQPDGAVLGEWTSGQQRNPSARHEALLELMKMFPETPLRLVEPDLQLGYQVRGPLIARAGDTDARGLRMDARLEYFSKYDLDDERRPVIAIIVEVQLGDEGDLRWRLCPYVGVVSHDCRCATDIVILCETRAIAKKLARPVKLGARGSAVVPLAVGPDEVPPITGPEEALADPGRLLLSAWFHTRRSAERREQYVKLLVQVIGLLTEIDPEKGQRYHELAQAILNDPSARRLREMTHDELSMYVAKKYYPDLVRKGKRESRAEDIMTLLEGRGISIPEGIREQIIGCTDMKRLSKWFKRAIKAGDASEVVA